MLAPWPSLAQACLAAGKASPSPAFGKLICTLQGPSPRSPPLGSLPKDLRPCLGLLSTPAGLTGGRGLPVQLRFVLCWGLWVRCALLFFPSGHCWLPPTPGHFQCAQWTQKVAPRTIFILQVRTPRLSKCWLLPQTLLSVILSVCALLYTTTRPLENPNFLPGGCTERRCTQLEPVPPESLGEGPYLAVAFPDPQLLLCQ